MVTTVSDPAGDSRGRATDPLAAPLVSVIVPTYNRSALLQQALQSILRQDYPSVQVIVVDDGSGDDTAAVVQGFPSVEYLRQANAGPSAARNLGQRAARGEYIGFLDADDLWDVDFLSTAVACLRSHADVAFACANWRGVDGAGSTVMYADKFRGFRSHMLEYGREVAHDWRTLTHAEARSLFVRHSAAPPSATVIRRQCAQHGWDPVARVGEDRLFFFGAIMHSGLGAAFCMTPHWSHRGGCGNEYFGRQSALVIERDIYAKRQLLSLYGGRLSRSERATLHAGLGESYFDLAYSRAGSRQWLAALAALPPCLRHRGVLRPGLALCRSAVRRLLAARSTARTPSA